MLSEEVANSELQPDGKQADEPPKLRRLRPEGWFFDFGARQGVLKSVLHTSGVGEVGSESTASLPLGLSMPRCGFDEKSGQKIHEFRPRWHSNSALHASGSGLCGSGALTPP